MDLTYAGYVTKLLEYLDNCRGLISTVDHAEIPIDHQIHTLKMDLRFLRTYLVQREGEANPYSYEKDTKDFVQNAESELHSLCLKLTTDKRMTREFELFVSNMINEMKAYKEKIRNCYIWKYVNILLDAPLTKEILKELVDSLLENLKDLQICETDLIVSVKKQIEALEEKVIFVRNFLSWLVDQRDSKDSIQKEKLAGLLTRIESAILGAVYWSYCCFVGEVWEIECVKCNISYVVWMIKHIELEVKDICVEFLKDSKSSQPDSLPVNLQTLVSIDSLHNILTQLLKPESTFMVPSKDKIGTLNLELRFLRALLMDPPPRKHNKHEEVYGLLTNIEAFITDAESSIHSLYGDKMKEETTNEMNILFSSFLDKTKLIKSEVRNNYIEVPHKPKFKSIGTDELGFIDLVLENLDEFLKCGVDSVGALQHQVQIIQGELMSLRLLLILENGNKHEHSEVIKPIIDVAHEVEYVINSYVVGDGPLWYHILKLSDLLEELKLIKTERGDIFNTKRSNNTVHNIQKTNPIVSQQARTVTTEEVMVGFEDQEDEIIKRLKGGSIARDVVSIVGMPGLGKTTLARKLYNDPNISFYFHICAWCCVSQTYQKRELLLDILSRVVDVTDRVRKMSDEDLAEQLYKGLKGRKYLIVMDDMWNIDAWNDLQKYFPNDHNGSRIMITSRINEVALQAKPDSSPHFLRLFSEEESSKLLQEKLFKTESCPMELVEIGEQIARNCKGLPLAVVLIAGILAKMDKKIDEWKQVAASLSTLIVNDSRQCRDILELSYMNLPDHLKPCFLYFGAFSEDKEIPVQKLLRLWIAEGFVHKSEEKGLEDVAENYLMDLVGRSLVIVDKTSSKGGVKTCRVHDLLHDFCLEKAKEEKFLQLINGRNELYAPYSGGSDDNASYHTFYSTVPGHPRLCIHSEHKDFVAWKPFNRQIHSLLVFATDARIRSRNIYPWDYSFIFYSLKLLKVLDLSSITMEDYIPSEIELLVYLRYLAVRGGMNSIPSSIVNLTKLETLFVKGVRGEVKLPVTLWEMVNLRHVLIEKRASLRLLVGRKSIQMHNLRTFGTPYLARNEVQIIRGCPNLRKFKCIFPESWDSVSNCNQFPALDFLSQLESLNVFYYGTVRRHCKFVFPPNLKKLTLTKFRLPWNEISQIGRLPNLEVLKLLFKSFEGKSWDVKNGEFLNLKYLKLDNLDIAEWNASTDHFPCLERLVLLRCKQLGELPSSLKDVLTLQAIEMEMCNPSAAESAIQIQEYQKEMGNEKFKILIKNC